MMNDDNIMLGRVCLFEVDTVVAGLLAVRSIDHRGDLSHHLRLVRMPARLAVMHACSPFHTDAHAPWNVLDLHTCL